MKIGPKYKIARRLGAAVFEKTQSQKYMLSEQKRKKVFSRPRSNYGLQLIEKQKVRYTYNITEKQLANYVRKSISSEKKNQAEFLFKLLEKRIDSIVLRAGFAKTRRLARQMVSHGHFKINGVRVTVPSTEMALGKKISVRESSSVSGLFSDYEDRIKDITYPDWIKVDPAQKTVELIKDPTFKPYELAFDLQSVLQFYKR